MLGALSLPQGSGRAVQSVEYRSSGLIFRATVRDAVIEMVIRQQLSDFIKTATNVNSSPTLTKGDLKTKMDLQDGDVIVLKDWPRARRPAAATACFSCQAFCILKVMRSLGQTLC